MENEDYTFVAQPKHNKKRKLYGIRDFPDGCGPFALRIDPNTLGKSNEFSLKLDMEDLENTELISAAKAIECDSSDVSKSSSKEVVLSDCSEFSSSDVNTSSLKKAKRKIVEAIRDFPPLCGPCAYILFSEHIENDNNDTLEKEVDNNAQDGL